MSWDKQSWLDHIPIWCCRRWHRWRYQYYRFETLDLFCPNEQCELVCHMMLKSALRKSRRIQGTRPFWRDSKVLEEEEMVFNDYTSFNTSLSNFSKDIFFCIIFYFFLFLRIIGRRIIILVTIWIWFEENIHPLKCMY